MGAVSPDASSADASDADATPQRDARQVVAQGELRESDLSAAYMRLAYPRWYVIALTCMVVALLALVVWAAWFSPRGIGGLWGSPARGALLVLVVAMLAYALLVGPSRTRGLAHRTWSRDPEAWRRARIAFDDGGVTVEMGERTIVYGWDEVHTLVDTRKQLLLFYDAPARFGFFRGTFLPVPKRLLAGPAEERDVQAMARAGGVTIRRSVPWHSRARK